MISKRNEIWLLQNGAVEYGHNHYPFIVMLHILFFISLIFEYSFHQSSLFSIFFLGLYLLIFAIKIKVISALGRFWNTKIYHIPGFPLINEGLYKYIKHPNYIIVVAEIAIIPMVFQLYYTAIIFSILNAIMLYIRITAENKVLEIDQ